MNELYEELAVITTLPGKPRIRYARMLGLLRRICLQQSAGFKSDYSTLFSRLTAVCLENEIDHRPADRFRRHARLVLHEGKQPEREEEKADTADLAYFIFQITGENIPDSLPQAIRPLKIKSPLQRPSRNERAIVKEILTSDTFRCLLASDSLTYTVHIGLKGAELEENLNITSYLWKEANVMLLDIRPETNKQDALEASMVITEPDYLIDVSSLAACIKPYGVSPLNYLIDHFTPHKVNRYNLLGNLANSFMDDCVNNQTNSDDLFIMALKKNYQEAVLSFACLPDDEIDRTFFEKAKLHFNHIRETVNNRFSAKDIGLNADELVLEPSFICPILGLRGRLDVMTIDFHKVLELKSGRADEKGREDVHPRPEHLVQMALYGEILRRNFGIEWGGVKSFLFYSNYPTLINERIGWASVKSVLHLRNGILLSLKLLAQGHLIDLLPRLTPERLNQNHQDNRFYHQYLEPQLTKITNPLRMLERDSLIYLYFSAFLSFILREQFLAKTSDNRPDSVRGFASTWTTDVRTKLLAGNILTGLKIVAINETKEKGITSLRLSLPEYSEDFVPNFNKGEMVQIYLAEDERANVTNKQLIRAIVMEITAETITIEPTYPQRNPHVFPLDRTYNVEHDASDSPFHSQISGLYTLLTAPQRRRELILGRTRPKLDERVDLNGTYSPAVEKIVLQAKRACDYFLLVGPPGTGKTNLALRSMVKEFLLSRKEGENILLTAYTNRAVDEICQMLDSLNNEIRLDYLRIGQPQTCDPTFHSHLLSQRSKSLPTRRDARRMIDATPIVVGTVLTLTSQQILFQRKRFKIAIVDEASQLLEPQILGLFCAKVDNQPAIEKFIFIGDHKQLPAVVTLTEEQTNVSDKELQQIGLTNLRNSFFERLHHLETKAQCKDFVATLTRQGRMHRDVSAFVNEAFYNGRLEIVPLPHQTEAINKEGAEGKWETFIASTRMGFVDIKQAQGSENIRANRPEANVISLLIKAIISLEEKRGHKDFCAARSIGVIVPFRSQIACIRGTLRNSRIAEADEITIDTVECYQGSQRDYILFSTTISRPYQLEILSSTQNVDGTEVDRKLNVALTRARKQCFIIGDKDLLAKNALYGRLIKYCTTIKG